MLHSTLDTLKNVMSPVVYGIPQKGVFLEAIVSFLLGV
jgi:hypothetical protein